MRSLLEVILGALSIRDSRATAPTQPREAPLTGGPQQAAEDQVQLEEGTVIQALDGGSLVVALASGASGEAKPATDEPITAGQRVWVIRWPQGLVVLGTVR
jgi:hypothetical protein